MTDPVTRLPVQAPPLSTGDVQLQDLPARCSAPDESGNSKITNLITDTIPDRAGPASDLHKLLDTRPYRVKAPSNSLKSAFRSPPPNSPPSS